MHKINTMSIDITCLMCRVHIDTTCHIPLKAFKSLSGALLGLLSARLEPPSGHNLLEILQLGA